MQGSIRPDLYLQNPALLRALMFEIFRFDFCRKQIEFELVPFRPSPYLLRIRNRSRHSRYTVCIVCQVHPLRASIVVGGNGKNLSLVLNIRVVSGSNTTGEGCSTRADLVAPYNGPAHAGQARSTFVRFASSRRAPYPLPRLAANLLQPEYASTTCRIASQPCTIVERSSG